MVKLDREFERKGGCTIKDDKKRGEEEMKEQIKSEEKTGKTEKT